MNLKNLADEHLLTKTKNLVLRERELLAEILHHLREIERRRLFSSLKCASLFEYATRELGYSEDQAYRRIQAMRLVKELPELEGKITTGTLSLTHLGLAQSLFKKEAKFENSFTRAEKIQLLERLEHTSKREAEKIIVAAASSPSALTPNEAIRVVSGDEVEVRFTTKPELLDKIQTLKGLLAHKHPNINLAELIDQLCDLGLEKWNPASSKAPRSRDAVPTMVTSAEVPKKPAQPGGMANGNSAPARVRQEAALPKASINASLRRDVWRQANGHCENCGSGFALEIDHRVPKALGGQNNRENLRLLCRTCNQRAAIEILGVQKMEFFLERAPTSG